MNKDIELLIFIESQLLTAHHVPSTMEYMTKFHNLIVRMDKGAADLELTDDEHEFLRQEVRDPGSKLHNTKLCFIQYPETMTVVLEGGCPGNRMAHDMIEGRRARSNGPVQQDEPVTEKWPRHFDNVPVTKPEAEYLVEAGVRPKFGMNNIGDRVLTGTADEPNNCTAHKALLMYRARKEKSNVARTGIHAGPQVWHGSRG